MITVITADGYRESARRLITVLPGDLGGSASSSTDTDAKAMPKSVIEHARPFSAQR
jgi:hypothetical protein